jgi:hypothetical protein
VVGARWVAGSEPGDDQFVAAQAERMTLALVNAARARRLEVFGPSIGQVIAVSVL